jgi:hypothetical protein
MDKAISIAFFFEPNLRSQVAQDLRTIGHFGPRYLERAENEKREATGMASFHR